MSSPVDTVWLAETRTSETTASCGAAISFCIFIASRINKVSPFLTAWPADTATDKILPGIGAFTVSAPAGTGAAAAAGAGAGAGAALGAAAGAALGAAAGAAAFTSLTSTSYAVPFTVTLNFSS